jgi:hypothetical protein
MTNTEMTTESASIAPLVKGVMERTGLSIAEALPVAWNLRQSMLQEMATNETERAKRINTLIADYVWDRANANKA